MFWSDSQPWVAGLARGVLLAIIAAVITVLTEATTNPGDIPGGAAVVFPVAIYLLRQGEAFVLDQFRSREDRMTPDV